MNEIAAILKHEYAHFNESGAGDYEVLISAISEIERLSTEIQEYKQSLISLRNTIGHCFRPQDYTQTCGNCLAAVNLVDDLQ
jgi:hypothetical protein